MLIKNIIISGFRSYREQLFPDGFSSNVNLILGKNGSGKSNLFAAIKFVLDEKYASISEAQRKELFYLGGKSVLSLFVEIIFDNTEGRLIIPGKGDENEVRIRRTVGLKQDEFRVNEKKFSAEEVYQLLEGAGFSSSNPYNIVEQGKVASLSSISEHARLQLIKDVAGTKVYETRRDESTKILEDTRIKLLGVDGEIEKLNVRIKDLESDCKELSEFQKLDTDKKVLENCVFTTDMDHTTVELQKLEKEKHEVFSKLDECRKKCQETDSSFLSHNSRVSCLTAQVQSLEAEKESVEKEIGILGNKQAIAELSASNSAQQKLRSAQEFKALESEKQQLTEKHIKCTEKIEFIKNNNKKFEKEYQIVNDEVQAKQREVNSLHERKNRTTLFKSKGERDSWIKQEVENKKQFLLKMSEELREHEKELRSTINEEQKLQSSISDFAQGAKSSEKELQEHVSLLSNTSKKRDALNQQRRALWQKIHEKELDVQRAKDNADFAREQYERSVRQDIRHGLESLRDILRDLNDPTISSKVYGTAIDLLTIEDGFQAAVDQTAGNALFNVIVDSVETSTILLEEMNRKRKRGRLTFLPLDSCQGFVGKIPETDEVAPLLSKVKADNLFSKVISEMFGRTAVVPTLQAGARLLKEKVVSCDIVTLEGDQIGRKGGLTGGFIDKLKLTAYENNKSAIKQLQREREKFDGLCQEVAVVEQEITEILNTVESIKNTSSTVESKTDACIREKRAMEDVLQRTKVKKEKIEASIKTLLKILEETKLSVKHLENEAADNFQCNWSEKNSEDLHSLTTALTLLLNKSLELQKEKLQSETDIQLEEETLHHIVRRLSGVDDRIRELERNKRADTENDAERAAINAEYNILFERLSKLRNELEVANKEKNKCETVFQALSTEKMLMAKKLEKHENDLFQLEAKHSVLLQHREELLQKIRQLGISSSSNSKLASQSIAKLMHSLKNVNVELANFSHVNRKAVDQFTSVTQSRDSLITQKNILAGELESIHELLDHLENEKDEAIERTYKQIQYQFEEIFKELVGGDECSAELQLVQESRSRTDRLNPSSSTKEYCGARLFVSFGGTAEKNNLEHLSGGQKSLVALALIFAIQRCDPAPFYLFDEIDAALDGEYREAVAKMIQKQSMSSSCQFIITTFKPEMLSVGNKFFAILFHNKSSTIQSINPEEAAGLLKQAAIDERKRVRDGDDDVEDL